MTPREERPRPVIRPAVAGDAVALAGRLRQDDLDELAAGDPLLTTPLEILQRSIAMSAVARTLLVGGIPEAVWGIVDEGGGLGRVWLLGAPRVTEDRRFFLAESAYQLQDLATGYSEVYNFVDERYEQALRWLRWLGFRAVARSVAALSGLPMLVMAWRVDDGTGSSAAPAHDHRGCGDSGDGVQRAQEAEGAGGVRGPG